AVITAANPGDVLELYGTGFGLTSPSVPSGLVFSGAYPTTAAPTVTIGGASVPVLFCGMVSPGLYQINVTVPSTLADGDYPVIATINGASSPSAALLKIKSS